MSDLTLCIKTDEPLVVYIFEPTATCDFQQCGILASVDSDEPVQPPFMLRNSK